ncbi:hypothetical protein FTUN_2930 [Frigoriglobus tundricola]|uniref:Uncharacterized protein n=1 Tax=Frigoriglobus tundricola TaxID=2774151 RepID=A0A6M5YQ51_9BACT|nr:hypothetical protein FTUN_2930 [Frigoriglobus tundricola]
MAELVKQAGLLIGSQGKNRSGVVNAVGAPQLGEPDDMINLSFVSKNASHRYGWPNRIAVNSK